MGDNRTDETIARIAGAVQRIEAAAERLQERSASPEAFEVLRARHERLRGQVQEAIGRIDALFAEERG